MYCPNCRNLNTEDTKFCRQCGTDLETGLIERRSGSIAALGDRIGLPNHRSKDPDELTGNGIGRVIIGDGFFMVAVILSATHTAVSSLLWLFLLIPAFYFFGTGFSQVLFARQLRRRLKQAELSDASTADQLPPPQTSFLDVVKKTISGELNAVPSVTERTTRELR